jgi:hypothetical protein
MARVPGLYRRGNVWRTAIGVVLIVLATSQFGCVATLEDAQAAKGSGTSRIYQKPYDVVWPVVVESIGASGLKMVSADRETGRILARRPPTMASWGENVAVFVDGSQQTTTRVEIVSKATWSVNMTAANWERRLFEVLDKQL